MNTTQAIRALPKWLVALYADQRGAALIMTALMIVALCGIAGLGTDAANWYTNERQMQKIADNAALAAAPLLGTQSNTTAMITAVAENVGVLDGLSTANGDTISVQVAADRSTVTVTASRNLQLYFSVLFLPKAPTTTATAVAGPGGTPVCILVLDPSGQSLLVNSGAQINAPNCQIDVASTSSPAAMIDSSLPNIAGMCVAGGTTVNGGAQVNNLTNHCTVASNPYAGTIPKPSYSNCTVSNQNYSGTVHLSPGTYCGSFNFNGSGTANLAAGTYILDGTNWNLNSGWTINGTAVTFYFVNSSSYIQINSGVTANLSAPTSGTYANVLMFEPDGLSTSSFTIDGSSSGHLLQGLIYLPSRNITFNSASNVTSDGMTLVANEVTFDTMNLSLSPSPNAINSANGSLNAVLLQ